MIKFELRMLSNLYYIILVLLLPILTCEGLIDPIPKIKNNILRYGNTNRTITSLILIL